MFAPPRGMLFAAAAQCRPFGAGLRAASAMRGYATTAAPECLYSTLGVTNTSTQSEIKKAYMQLAKLHHPDRHISDDGSTQKEAHDRFAAITAAFDVLSDTHKRSDYDLRSGTFANTAGGGAGFSGSGYRGNGFQQGSGINEDEFIKFHNGPSPYKIFSNNTVVWLATIWMVGGAMFHYLRFESSHEEHQKFVHQKSKTAATHLNVAHSRAKENGHKVQLEMLRDQRDGV